MSEIKKFPFEKEQLEQIKAYKFGKNWPVVYIIENGKEIYIGETIHAYNRSKQHYENNADRRKLKNIFTHVYICCEITLRRVLPLLMMMMMRQCNYVIDNNGREITTKTNQQQHH